MLQRYGHIALVSKGKQSVPNVEEIGLRAEETHAQAEGFNCDGQHNVTHGGCEVRKRAEEIQQVLTA